MLKDNRANVITYLRLAVVLLFVYHQLSDGDFSFLMVRAPFQKY